jgi:hypothetical protein
MACKIYPKWDFWFENISSGNPAFLEQLARKKYPACQFTLACRHRQKQMYKGTDRNKCTKVHTYWAEGRQTDGDKLQPTFRFDWKVRAGFRVKGWNRFVVRASKGRKTQTRVCVLKNGKHNNFQFLGVDVVSTIFGGKNWRFSSKTMLWWNFCKN